MHGTHIGDRVAFVLLPVLLLAACRGHSQEARDDPRIEQELIQLERDWSAAFLRHDTTTIARILGDDYVGTDGRAFISNKAQELAEATAPELGQPASAFVILEETLSDMSVRHYGATAIVNGLSTEKVAFQGKEMEVRYRRTTVWVMRDDRWQCVSFHASRINE